MTENNVSTAVGGGGIGIFTIIAVIFAILKLANVETAIGIEFMPWWQWPFYFTNTTQLALEAIEASNSTTLVEPTSPWNGQGVCVLWAWSWPLTIALILIGAILVIGCLIYGLKCCCSSSSKKTPPLVDNSKGSDYGTLDEGRIPKETLPV